MALETGLDPPPFMANAILNFHFDFLHPSLINNDLPFGAPGIGPLFTNKIFTLQQSTPCVVPCISAPLIGPNANKSCTGETPLGCKGPEGFII